MYRILANIVALMSLFVLPFWCTVLLLIVVSFFFDFVEIVAYGFIFDVMFGVPGNFFESNMFTLSAIALYGIILLVKPYIKL